MSPDLSWSGKSVIIVDDSEKVREELDALYTQAGMRVIGKAENGIEALRLFERDIPDMFSLDIIMPEMDGIECFRMIKTKMPQMPCLFISVLGNDPNVTQKFNNEIPAYLFLGKPVTLALLTSKLQKLFSRDHQENATGGTELKEAMA